MINPITLIMVFCLYMGLLFSVALWVEHKTVAGRAVAANPVVYSLSLAIYCTAWTFYGSIGNAAAKGPLFLAIYIGPTLGIALWWIVLRRFVRIKRMYHITSIADFISVRYGKSHAVAAVVTMMVIVGIVPYVALQIKAIISTFSLITGAGNEAGSVHYTHIVMIGILAMFTIIFGIRHLDPTERHPGMISALAAESLVKLLAFLAAGVFVAYFMFDGIDDIFRRFAAIFPHDTSHFNWGASQSVFTWFTYLVLSCSAVMFLPRQFHVTVVENYDERHIQTAMWMFPLYMFLINIFVLPIALAGLLKGYPVSLADTFLLRLPLDMEQQLLSMLVFIGGISAATGMIMIETITMSTMTTNHLLLPLIEQINCLGFLKRHLLQCRWLAALAFLALGYLFERTIGESYMLVNIGMISFVAVFQFAPAIIGGIFWRQGNRKGALLGLCSGFFVWGYTLLLPALVKSHWLPGDFMVTGPLGFVFLHPEHLFGVTGLDPISNAVFWSMFFNLGLYILCSLSFEQDEMERGLAEEFVNIVPSSTLVTRGASSELLVDLEPRRREIEVIFSQYFPKEKASEITKTCLVILNIEKKERITLLELTEFHSEAEKRLSGAIGAAAAHHALKKGTTFSPQEELELSKVYYDIIASLKLSPAELMEKIDFYQEKEKLLTRQAMELEEKIRERDLEIEERLRVEKALEMTNLELQQFAYIASHDLQEPLRKIQAFGDRLRSTSADVLGEKSLDYLTRMQNAAARMRQLIEDLLNYSRVTTRGNPFAPVNLEALIGEVVIDLEQRIAETGGRVEIGPLPEVNADKSQMGQLFLNLISNALKFHRDSEKPVVRIEGRRTDGMAKISVQDNGIGFDEKYLDRIFIPFQRLHSRDEFEGTGIGLAVCKKIVERHGGTISASSVAGEGATFILCLPGV